MLYCVFGVFIIMVRALVTGGCGFIGSHVVGRLIEEGFEVLIVDNLTTGRIENIQGLKPVQLISKDLNLAAEEIIGFCPNISSIWPHCQGFSPVFQSQ